MQKFSPFLLAASRHRPGAVSYTHLDVYKRQTIDNDIVILGGEFQEGIQETIEMYQSINPAIESTVIPDTRHLPQMEAPGEFLEQLSIYL